MRISSLVTFLLLFGLAGPAQAQAPDAWSQEVAYEMDITLQADRHRMQGHQRVQYTNNSPDTLDTVYYHLYFNAFHPNSMMAERNRHLPDPDGRIVPRIFNLGPDEIGFHRIESLTQNGQPVAYHITDTVVRVDLNEPIPPGTSTVFRMRFHSQVPLQTRRSGRDNREGIDYSMSQWYPKIAEYDERGWHADPYVGREFYAPYGTFDVEITLPADYTIGATGVLQNPDEVGHGYDAEGAATYRPSGSSPTDSLTWHFHAENVHDFAWAADPDFIHEKIPSENGPTYHLLYEPDVEERWQPMHRWVPDIIDFFSEQYGPYPYPQFTVAQAGDGGMEYPMINFLTGERSPGSLLGVTAHEAAHEWFYATLGSNEADYAWMDEGFTSYATSEAVAHVAGRDANHQGSYLSILSVKERGLFERFNTPSDWFTTNVAYGVAAYPGGEMLVDMMGYVISDSLRDEWLQAYYRERTFQHPDPFDLEALAEDVSGLRLDWYFEQVLNMDRSLDYAVDDLQQRRTADGWEATISLERVDGMVMPIDLRLTLADGSEQWVNIPLGIMQGHKPVADDWIVADPWLWTFPEYSFSVDLPAEVTAVEIDPRGQMPDRNRLNNRDHFPRRAHLLQPPQPSWFEYGIGYRPLIQYADQFGVGAGVQARGQYIFGRHQLEATLTLWPQIIASGGDDPDLTTSLFGSETSFIDGIDYALRYTRDLRGITPQTTLTLGAEHHLGIFENTVRLRHDLSSYGASTNQHASLALIHQYAPTDRVFAADNAVPTLSSDRSLVSARFDYTAEGEGDRLHVMGEVGSSTSFSSVASASDGVARFRLDAVKTVPIGPFEARAAFAFGMGSRDLAFHKRFRLGAASFEERWRSDAFRSVAAPFEDPLGEVHLAALQPMGPQAYLLAADGDGLIGYIGGTPLGRNMVAGRLSLQTGLGSQNTWIRPLHVEAFSGYGTAWSDGDFLSGFDTDALIADAGLSLAYDVATLRPLQRWTRQSDVLSGLRLRAAFPLWASDPGIIDTDEDEFAFRWLLGVEVGL